MRNCVEFSVLVGLELASIKHNKPKRGNEDLVFTTKCGRVFRMFHEDD